jgi:hypothetical protein
MGITCHLDKKNISCPSGEKDRSKAQKTKGVRNNPSRDFHTSVQCSAGEIDTRNITDESVGSEKKGALLFTVISEFCEEIQLQVSKFHFHLFHLYHSTTIPHLVPTSDPQTPFALMTEPQSSPAPTNSCQFPTIYQEQRSIAPSVQGNNFITRWCHFRNPY